MPDLQLTWGCIVKRLAMLLIFIGLVSAVAQGGVISTDRFGYTGTTTKYATLEDAQSGQNAISTTTIGNRDLSLFIVDDQPSYYGDTTAIMGSWWYSTDPSGNPGYGNTSGNTGVGFLQLYEDPATTLNSLTMGFGNYDGTYYTTFSVALTGSNSTTNARFSPFTSNTNDGGIYLSYMLNLTASGLQGQDVGGLIESTNQPTGVTGSFTGLFQNTSSDQSKQGFYTFNLTLDTTNWSFDNADSLTYPAGGPGDVYGFANAGFQDSYFAAQAVPEPSFLLLLGIGLGTVTFVGWRRKK
jgi:hypothetical protein